MELGDFFAGAGKRPAPARAGGPAKGPAPTSEEEARREAERLADLLRHEEEARVYGPMTPGEYAARVKLSQDFTEALDKWARAWNRERDEAAREREAAARVAASVPRTWLGNEITGEDLADAIREGKALSDREQRRAAYLARVAPQQYIGQGPSPDPRPRCAECNRIRALVTVARGPEGDVALCAECATQILYDRERRCTSCAEPTEEWLPGGVCRPCHKRGFERATNLRNLRELRWAMNPGQVRP